METKKCIKKSINVFLITLVLFCASVSASWPQFQGTNRNGISSEIGFNNAQLKYLLPPGVTQLFNILHKDEYFGLFCLV